MLVKMKITGLTIDPLTNAPIVILKDQDEQTILPIWIGILEASAIAAELDKITLARPMTHDLIRDVMKSTDVNLEKVEVIDLVDNVYYAVLHIYGASGSHKIDARPSDAIALALRMGSPIFVDTRVIEKSKTVELPGTSKHDNPNFSQSNNDSKKWIEMLEQLNVEDFGKYKM